MNTHSHPVPDALAAVDFGPEARDYLARLRRDYDPQRFRVRGMWRRMFTEHVRHRHGVAAAPRLELLAGVAWGGPLSWQPMVDTTAVLIACAEVVYPERPIGDAARTLIAEMTEGLLQQSVLSTLFRACEGDFPRFLDALASSTRLYVSHGRVWTEPRGAGAVDMSFEEHSSIWFELANLGFFRSAMVHLGLEGTATLGAASPWAGTVSFRWTPSAP